MICRFGHEHQPHTVTVADRGWRNCGDRIVVVSIRLFPPLNSLSPCEKAVVLGRKTVRRQRIQDDVTKEEVFPA